MAAPYNLIEDKAERALQILIQNAATGIDSDQVLTGFNSGATSVGDHFVSIIGQGAIETAIRSENFQVSVIVTVQSNLDQSVTDEGGDEVDTHRELAGKVFDVICDTDLAINMSAAIEDFTVFDCVQRRMGRQRVENRKAISEMILEFPAAPSTIA